MEISRGFRRFVPQLLHMIVLPLFFFAFMLVYRPFNVEEFIGIEWFGVHVTILSCIICISTVFTRLLYYFIPMKLNYTLYTLWCFAEMFFVSFFAALYIWLVLKLQMPYYEILAPSIEIIVLSLVFPYTVIALSVRVYEYHQNSLNVNDDSPKRIRFYDDKRNLKIVLADDSILYFAVEENYVNIFYLDDGRVRTFVLRSTMKAMEDLCQDFKMIRCHRSYMINPDHVKMIRKDSDGVVVAELDAPGVRSVPVSKRYYERLARML